MYSSAEELVFAVAKRAKDLADLPMSVLRKCGYGEVSEKYATRGELIEESLTLEFSDARIEQEEE
jgi:hypothetical protein